MAKGHDDNTPVSWMVQGPDVASGALLQQIGTDTSIQVVRKVGQDVLILKMTPIRARQLKSEFARVIVELDADIDLFR